MMSAKKDKIVLYGKLRKLISQVNTSNKKASRINALPSRLSEIDACSKKVIALIEQITAIGPDNLTKRKYDKLLGELVNLRVQIYDELLYWIKIAKDPLQMMINLVEKKLNDDRLPK
jgi:hypothetical protein